MADFDTWKIIDNFTDCNNRDLIMNAFYRIMAAVMIAGVTLASCEVQSPEPDDNGQPPVDNVDPDIPAGEEGEMTFEIETLGQVTVEGPLEMTIVQTSSYTDLFAGKMHALVYRAWKNRVKGRDWYDFEWYVRHNVPLDLAHLAERCNQFNNEVITPELFKDKLKERL